MKNKLLALATAAGLAVIAGQASAITTSTTGNATVTPIIPGEAFFWTVQTNGGPSTASFTAGSKPVRAQFSWSVLGIPTGSLPTFVFTIENGGGGVFSQQFSLPAGGDGILRIAAGGPLTFTMSQGPNDTGTAVGSGQVTFAPIPLPAGVLLLLTALGGLAATRKLSKKPELA